MNALTWNLIVLLLVAYRLVRFGVLGIVFHWNQLLLSAEAPRPLSSGRVLGNVGRTGVNCDFRLVDRVWFGLSRLFQLHGTRERLEDRLLNFFATYHPLEALIAAKTPYSCMRVASI